MVGLEDAGRWSLLETDEEQVERVIGIYLQRWGVIYRGVLEGELFLPPWRVFL